MQRIQVLSLTGLLIGGCASTHNPSHTTEYDLSTVDKGGIYEMRSYLSQGACPAEKISGAESAGLVMALAAPLIEKGVEVAVDAAMKKVAAYGNALAQPLTIKSETYPGKVKPSALTKNGCLFVAYGQYGGMGRSNISKDSPALKRYVGSSPSRQLTSQVGFAMQIGIDIVGSNASLTPLHLFYPRAFHTGSSVDKHSLAVEVLIGEQKVVMTFDEVEAGSYYEAESLVAHKKTLDKASLAKDTISLSVTEGPDNKLLGEALADFASDAETKKQLVSEIQTAIKERLDDKPAAAAGQ